jgi:hypothetical protein
MSDQLEDAITARLDCCGLSKKQIDRIVAAATDLSRKTGIKPGSIFPIGIVVNDGAVLDTHLDAAGLDKLIDWIKKYPGVDGLEIFPKGIPASPDTFAARVRFR